MQFLTFRALLPDWEVLEELIEVGWISGVDLEDLVGRLVVLSGAIVVDEF